MRLDQPGSDNSNLYDLSFMYTLQCDLTCPFCMYTSGPDVNDTIDLEKLEQWLGTVDMDRISSFGVYGGEVACDLEGFGKCLDLVAHVDKPRFVITNGTWSKDMDRLNEFLEFCIKYNCHIVVSGTPWHRRHQHREVLEALKEEQPKAITLKPKEENFHAMGRLAGRMKFQCSRKCSSWEGALRIAVQPNGNIIYQNCDGIYPIVGNICEPFSTVDARIRKLRLEGFHAVCHHYKDETKGAFNKRMVDVVTQPDLSTCPGCGGDADNGFSRDLPPVPYYCTKCQSSVDGSGE